MTLTAARQVADAVLYEGYLLYPYRGSSAKNQVRWQFGVLGPEGAAAAGVGEPPSLSCELLVEARPDATVDVRVRFLQVQFRMVERLGPSGWEPVDELHVGGTRWIPFHEAVPREVVLAGLTLGGARARELRLPGGCDVEQLYEGDRLVGRLVRTRSPLHGALTLTARPGVESRLTVLGVRVENRARWEPAEVTDSAPGSTARDTAARTSFVSTHLLLTVTGTRVISLLDGPAWAAADAKACRQSRCWPVLVADDDGTDAVLVSPIILGDHPRIAPESAGDLFDATEIDEILTLRVMTMTAQEKADARGTDPRAAALLARCDGLRPDALERLHGGRREPELYARAHADARPEVDTTLVGGVLVAKGSRVRLRPSRKADAQDLFLAGLTAEVARVYSDLDGRTHVAVMLEDDPGRDLYATTGRFYYFAPDELEALPDPEATR